MDAAAVGQAGVASAISSPISRLTSGLRAQILERGIGEVVPLGPIADRRQVDRDDRRDKRPAIAKGDRLGDVRAEFELVFDELRARRRAVGELADILGAIDDDEMAAPVDEAGVAGAQPAVRR